MLLAANKNVATVLFPLVSFPGLFRVSRDIMSHA